MSYVLNTVLIFLNLREKNEPFCLENASNLTREFLYDMFNKKNFRNFLVKGAIQKLKIEVLRSESVNKIMISFITNINVYIHKYI